MGRLLAWFRRTTLDRDLEKELQFHLDQHVRDLVATGVSHEDAQRRARIDLGGVDQVTERVRASRSGAWLDRLGCDARDAWRGLKRTPGTALTAVTLIALVIGGNTTIFSMVHGILTKPARGVQANGLVTLEPRTIGNLVQSAHSYPDYLDYVAQSRTLRLVLAAAFERFTVSVPDGTFAVRGSEVTTNYFDTLGVHLVRGRSFTDEENRLDTSGLVAVVSYRLWQEQLHGAETVIGQPVVLNGHPATVIGVAPPQFQGTWLAESSQVWVPLVAYARVQGRERVLNDRASGGVLAVGQLAPGVSLAQAQAEVTTIATRLQAAYPDTNQQKTVRLVPYSVTAGGDSLISQQGSTFLAVFSVITVLTVLIVCANVANLMLARAAVRQRETAVRRALGASRLGIVRALLIEGLVISMVAWLAACLFAVWTARVLVRLFPPGAQGTALPLDFAPDWRVVAYAMGLALVGTVAFTLPPALRAWRQDLLPWLKAGEQGVVQGRSTLSSVLVIVQLAFAVLLLTGAGLAYRSASLISTRALGFTKENLLLTTINTSGAATGSGANLALLETVRDRLHVVPGVRSVSYARSVPSMPGTRWPDQAVQQDETQVPLRALVNVVGPEYLRVLGLSPVAGRDIAANEGAHTQAVAMINQDLADALWPRQSAVGRTLRLGPRGRPVDIVGVTPNALFSGYDSQTRPNFVLLSQENEPAPPGDISFYIRFSGTLEAIAPAIGRALREVDARMPIVYMRTVDTELDTGTWPVHFISTLLALFAVGSLTIAAIGQYAVIAFDMRRRTRDFGVRMALGASSRQILRGVVQEGLRWTAIGLAIGLVLSLGVGRALRSVLFGVTPTDTRTYLGVFGVLFAASLLACYLPARRAARIDPMQALRQE